MRLLGLFLVALGLTEPCGAQIYKSSLNGATYYGNKPFSRLDKTPVKSSPSRSVKKIAYIYKYLDHQGGFHISDEPLTQFHLISKTKVEVGYTPSEAPHPTASFYKFSGTPVPLLPRPVPSYDGVIEDKWQFDALIADVALRYRLDEKLLHAMIQTESAYNPKAVSPAGAVGLMQLMPDTAVRYGVADRSDPVQNIHGGARYLRDLLDMFSPNVDLAIAAYNAGENAVLKYNYTIPPYAETQNYVRQVLARYNR